MTPTIPIIIICYNNHKYVENTIQQLLRVNPELHSYIFIMDNKSTLEETQTYLRKSPHKVFWNLENQGPWVTPYCNAEIFHLMPDKFILTDPDLEFHPDIPRNFVSILSDLSDKYNSIKIGFALDISDKECMFEGDYVETESGIQTIWEWESQFWKKQIEDPTYKLYHADIDTTFCLINKNGIDFTIRVADNFSAKHLPWYKKNSIYNTYENYMFAMNSTSVSTIAKKIIAYTESEYLKTQKNNQLFLIENNLTDPNLTFWKDIYTEWENETFEVFDRFLDPTKVFLDIGGWIGTTCMYAGRKSKHTYIVEADKDTVPFLENNCKNNIQNYTVIHNAIYNVDDMDICFGKNEHLGESKLNDSTSQIQNQTNSQSQSDKPGVYTIKTITLSKLIAKYGIDVSNISLIKVDIEGGEENILEDLYKIHTTYKVPMYVSFHYSWWKNMDLHRFAFLTDEQKNAILWNPFTSLLFC